MIISRILYEKYFSLLDVPILKNIDDNYYEVEDTLKNRDIELIINTSPSHYYIVNRLAFYNVINGIIETNNKEIERLENEINNTLIIFAIIFFPLTLFKLRYLTNLKRENIEFEIKLLSLMLGRVSTNG